MDMHYDKKYKKNALVRVFIRVDFENYLPDEVVVSEYVESAARKYFPNRQMEQVVKLKKQKEVALNDVDGNSCEPKYIEGVQREYRSKNEKNKVVLSNKYLVFEIGDYDTFTDLSLSYLPLLKSIFENSDAMTQRIGIRYVNIFNSNVIKPKKSFFNSKVAETVTPQGLGPGGDIELVRSYNITEYQIDEMSLAFRHGLYNPDYPNILIDKSFTLDFDCYTLEGSNNWESVYEKLSKGHNSIEKLFEYVITDDLRRVFYGK